MKTIGILIIIPIVLTLEVILIPFSLGFYIASIVHNGTITERLIEKI
jgi:hypothetical protein